MSYMNEHSARITDPAGYDEIKRKNDYFDNGIHALFGIKEGKSEVQSIHFDVLEWTEIEARKWLKDHYYKPTAFEVAELPEATFRICQPGDYVGQKGPFNITAQDIDDAIDAFGEASSYGILPDIKYTHAKGVMAVGVGKGTSLFKDPEGWLCAKANILDPNARTAMKRGLLKSISLEGKKNKPVYGSRIYGLVITAISILAPGEWPAVPGAGLIDIAAGQSNDKVVVMVTPDNEGVLDPQVVEAAEGDSPADEEPVVEQETSGDEPTEDMEEALPVEERIAALEARIMAIEESLVPAEEEPPVEEPEAADEDEDPEPEAEEDPEEEPVDAGTSDADIEASITAAVAGIQAGRRESFRAHINGLGDNSAKQIALATAVALGIVAEPEVLAAGPGEAGEAETVLSREDKQEKAVTDIMAQEKVGIVEATVMAAKADPDLFT